ELTLHTPLVLPETDGVRLQVVVGAPDVAGARTIAVHSRPEDAPADEPWTQHAAGTLTEATADAGATVPPDWTTTWPPAGAVPLDVDGFYERLAASGVDYGPAFRGMRAAWRSGDGLFAEIALGTDHERDTAGFAVHPALLDAGVQTLRADVDADATDSEDVRVAFSWHGVRFFHAAGTVALRARLAPTGDGAVSMSVADEEGRTVAVVESLTVRPISAEQLRAAGGVRRDSLFRMCWNPVPVPGTGSGRLVLLGENVPAALDPAGRWPSVEELGAAVAAGEPVPDVAVLRAPDTAQVAPGPRADVLAQAAAWAADPGFGSARLVVVTRRAVSTDGDDQAPDPAQAALWAALRALQAGHPDRIVLADIDSDPAWDVLPTLPFAEEPRLAVRGGRVLAPRLRRVGPADRQSAGVPDLRSVADGTVLVTGADGPLAAALAGHLIAAHGVRRLTLVPSGGRDTDAVRQLAHRLTEAGTDVEVLTRTPELRAGSAAGHALTGVLHAAEVNHGDRAPSSGPELLEYEEAAQALHELIAEHDPAFFVTLSSADDLPGAAGRTGVGAADALTEALTAHRRARGLPVLSLAWGPNAFGGSHGEGELPAGLVELPETETLALFDAALGLAGGPELVLARLDRAALLAHPEAVRGPLRDLAGGADARRSGRGADTQDALGADALARRLATLSEDERERELVTLVRTQAAAVLGLPGTEEVGPERAFKEVGFDSLMAVELRNRLMRGTGVHLRSTLVFDYPNPVSLARHVLERLAEAASAATPMLADLDRLHEALPTALSEDGARDRIAERLRELLALCEAPDDTLEADDLESATDDELFSLVDQGFE
ncbi:polyketide synthase dehydratase domain-containing protein, partial [Streptomyces sp. UNOC14_S4]|uniref:polyketide synthase dehydratase domain-containing protein n=1 Tax=Streptomyces sp. UNOC14_S4 TaxID=2872340 RepID=UPI001E398B37